MISKITQPSPYTAPLTTHQMSAGSSRQSSSQLPHIRDIHTSPFFFGDVRVLDLTNLLYNARNFDHDVEALLVNIPNGAQIVVRQTGGYNHHNRWKNHHNQPIKPEALASLRGKRAEVQSLPAVSVERDDLLPPLEVLCEEAFAAAAVWQTEQWS